VRRVLENPLSFWLELRLRAWLGATLGNLCYWYCYEHEPLLLTFTSAYNAFISEVLNIPNIVGD